MARVSSTLDIDVGNSRIKWRSRGEEGVKRGAIDRSEVLDPTRWPLSKPARIRVSSVASRTRTREIEEFLQGLYFVQPEFAKTTRFAAGITCGYDDPARLGVDRWLSLLAARQLSNGPFVVVGLGTAGTLDFVDAQGAHKGGFIVPGLRLMTDALFSGTADVQVAFEPTNNLAPGTNTPDAVRRGVASMLADFVGASIQRWSAACADEPRVYLSGGDADLIAPLINVTAEIRSELVLDGLSLALP